MGATAACSFSSAVAMIHSSQLELFFPARERAMAKVSSHGMIGFDSGAAGRCRMRYFSSLGVLSAAL